MSRTVTTRRVKLSHHVRKVKSYVYKMLPESFRAFRAMAKVAGFSKLSLMNDSTITRLVESELRKEGVEAPDIDWGSVFNKALNNWRHGRRMSDAEFEEVQANVIQNMVMGEKIQKMRDRGKWKHNLVSQIKEWVEEGRNEGYMAGSLNRWIKDKASNVWESPIFQEDRHDQSFRMERRDDEYDEAGEVLEEVFELESLSGGEVNTFMSVIKDTPELRDLIDKLNQKLKGREDDIGLVWQAYMNDPDAPSLNALLDTKVNTSNGRMPLWEALGFEEGDSSNKGKLDYRVRKLRKLLKSMMPELKSTLRDLGLKQ